jgi:hypothetical protein
MDLYGENGGPMLAEALRLPFRTWMNDESGVTVSGPVVLGFIELTRACPHWSLTGELPEYQPVGGGPYRDPIAPSR